MARYYLERDRIYCKGKCNIGGVDANGKPIICFWSVHHPALLAQLGERQTEDLKVIYPVAILMLLHARGSLRHGMWSLNLRYIILLDG
eukprot:scaffold16816_cov118-Skeletonema_dohrnii-CCMP3373.AAC.5